jgi:hypothetical protein
MSRVRHHTDDTGLEAIEATGVITVARGWGSIATGVHVEIEPFGTTRTGQGGPKRQLGCVGEGAYVEFDAPAGMVPYSCGERNTAIIPTEQPFPIRGLAPTFVKVRRHWWELWRKKPE